MPDNNKVLHLVSAEMDWEPGSRIAALAAALREYGLGSVVTAPEQSRLWEMAEAAGVEALPVMVENSINPLRWMELANAVKALDPCLIHVHDSGAAQLLARAGRFSNHRPVVVSRYALHKAPIGAEYGSNVGAVVCSSKVLADAFIKSGAAPEKVRIVYDGVNIANSDHAVDEREDLRVKYRNAFCPGKEKPLFIVNIAPLVAESGQADILEAMTEVVAALPQCHLFIVGEGPLREDLDRQIRIMALERDVTLMEPDKAYARIMAAADLYVSASRNDVTGLMVQHAQAEGRATALVNAGCYAEMIEDGKTGVLAAAATAEALREAMLELLENRTRREHLGRLAKARALKLFNIKNQAGNIAEIYGEVLG